MNSAILETAAPGTAPTRRGKVRDLYDLGDRLLLVATDRISAYDVVNPVGIPDKGVILTQLSLWWFEQMANLVPNHLISAAVEDFPEPFRSAPEQFAGRSMLVHRCEMLPIEVVVRGYLAGSGWREYRQSGTVCGIPLPAGLREADPLPEPIYTPATKAESGHDINISPRAAGEIVGTETNARLADIAQALYARARDIAAGAGIVLADTKFEFGWLDGQLVLADEIFTPDSSRFWPAEQYAPGESPPSFDKQFVRDWLDATDWDKQYPAPPLPEDVVHRTREKYVQAYRQLTGREDL